VAGDGQIQSDDLVGDEDGDTVRDGQNLADIGVLATGWFLV
jgi:hypothetical protein